MRFWRGFFPWLLLVGAGLLTACSAVSRSAQPLDPEAQLATAVVGTLQAQGVTVLPPAMTPPTVASPTWAAPGPSPTARPTRPSPTAVPTAAASPTAVASPTPTPQPNTPSAIEGRVCYLSAAVPAMTVYIQAVDSDQVYEVPIAEGQTSYRAEVPPGRYYVYAWLPDFSQSGSYSQAVVCGLTASCTNHTLLPVTVEEGRVTTGVDVCDWYHGPFDVPYPPNVEIEQATGAIQGNLSYPGDRIPRLQVVAFNLDTGYWYWVGTAENQRSYTIAELPPGRYHVAAYVYGEDRGAGYTADVVHHNGDHSLLEVVVRPGKTTTGVDLYDWNASLPPNPAK